MTPALERVVEGCSTCPFAFLNDGCLPKCVLDDEAPEGIGSDPESREFGYAFRQDAPAWCPLRGGPLLVQLRAQPR